MFKWMWTSVYQSLVSSVKVIGMIGKGSLENWLHKKVFQQFQDWHIECLFFFKKKKKGEIQRKNTAVGILCKTAYHKSDP